MSLVCTSKGHLKRGGVIHDFSLKSCMAIFNMRNGESANGERRNGERRIFKTGNLWNGKSSKAGIFKVRNFLAKGNSFLVPRIPRLADSPFLLLKRAHNSSRCFFTEEEWRVLLPSFPYWSHVAPRVCRWIKRDHPVSVHHLKLFTGKRLVINERQIQHYLT